ncbi:MAG: putative Se/S carrier-like protein, partial [Ruminiclostridium sp.]
YKFEVLSTPCHIAKGSCGLCLKFPEEFLEVVVAVATESNTPIRQVYKVIPSSSKNKYRRI